MHIYRLFYIGCSRTFFVSRILASYLERQLDEKAGSVEPDVRPVAGIDNGAQPSEIRRSKSRRSRSRDSRRSRSRERRSKRSKSRERSRDRRDKDRRRDRSRSRDRGRDRYDSRDGGRDHRAAPR